MTTFLLPSVAQRLSYRLDDDGTLAVANEWRAGLSMNSPAKLRVDYTYVNYSSGLLELAALPKSLPSRAVSVPSGGLAAEMIVRATAVSAFSRFYLQLLEVDKSTGSILESLGKIGIQDVTGGSPVIYVNGSTFVRSSPVLNYRVGIEIASGLASGYLRTTDGNYSLSASPFDPTNKVAFAIVIRDPMVPSNVGSTVSLELLTKAADMGLTYTAGVRALDMKTI